MSKPTTQSKLIDDCFLHDKDRLKHHEALAILRERLSPIAPIETVALDDAGGRILAETIKAPVAIPNYDNSAVDGYAFNYADYVAGGGRFEISQRIAAGDTSAKALKAKTAARIFTGAAMPAGADTVAMQEDCKQENESSLHILIPKGLKAGANCRLAGEDVRAGEHIAECGQRLTPPLMAAIASTGAGSMACYKRLRVAIVSTGNELKEPGDALMQGQVYDANRPLLRSLLAGLPVTIIDVGILKDDATLIRETIDRLSNEHDVIITTGGASKGEEDHLVNAIDTLGSRHLWQLAIKPGRPMSFGQIGNCVVFGLPGNPVAGFVCFLLYVYPSLLRLGGADWFEPQRFELPAGFEIAKKKPDRREFWRGWVESEIGKEPFLCKFDRDGSGLISGLRSASGLIEVGESVTGVSKGERLAFIPFSQFGF